MWILSTTIRRKDVNGITLVFDPLIGSSMRLPSLVRSPFVSRSFNRKAHPVLGDGAMQGGGVAEDEK
ncbi:hypothetical protein Mal65_54420 [Crateriforma conspicua]|nr:hypothetical protein Mal65_54420 [Crateriforma conspicua]